MKEAYQRFILELTQADEIAESELIQELWSGYGQILRLRLKGGKLASVVVKWVQLNQVKTHPRGWQSDIGHARKIKSYQVESHWYQNYSDQSAARLPQCLAHRVMDQEVLLILEDLDTAGFPLRKTSLGWSEIDPCLAWLARFHASFLDRKPHGLWENGSYWHLNTRPEELEALKDLKLKEAASAIDQKLREAQHQTIIHGDAKLANFCFSETGSVAGVDFQYVGGGCGMIDLAYFVGSCLSEQECEMHEEQILNRYFHHFQQCLSEPNLALEEEWRSLYRVAWADFHRFLKGWSPSHWKINSYSEKVCREVIEKL